MQYDASRLRNRRRLSRTCASASLAALPDVPLAHWLPAYRWAAWLPHDVLAGVVVALMLIPQSLAYANVASLPARYGLLASYVGLVVYAVFGTSREVSLGPTAIMSLLVNRALASRPGSHVPVAFTLSLLAGVIQLALGVMRLGVLAELLSGPVVTGFVCFSAVTIAFGQVHTLLGTPGSEQSTVDEVRYTFEGCWAAVHKAWPDLALGLACLAALVLLAWQRPGPTHADARWSRVRNLLAMLRSPLVVCLAALLAAVLYAAGVRKSGSAGPCDLARPCSPLTLVGHIPSGFDSVLAWPSVSRASLGQAAPYAPLLALVGFLEAISIAKAVARDGGYEVEPSQELVAIGVTNVLGSFLSAYPTTASFSRTAVNRQSGARSPLSGLVSAVLVVASLEWLTPVLAWVPKAALAAIIIVAAGSMFEWRAVRHLWRFSRLELVVLFVSFIACMLLDLAVGIAVAVVVSLAVSLLQLALVPVSIALNKRCLVVRPAGPLNFTSIALFVRRVRAAIHATPVASLALVLDLSRTAHVDASAAAALGELVASLSGRGGAGASDIGGTALMGESAPLLLANDSARTARAPDVHAVLFVGLALGVRTQLLESKFAIQPSLFFDTVADACASLGVDESLNA